MENKTNDAEPSTYTHTYTHTFATSFHVLSQLRIELQLFRIHPQARHTTAAGAAAASIGGGKVTHPMCVFV